MEDLPAANEGVADERACEWGWNIIWAPRRPTLASATGSGAGARGRDIEAGAAPCYSYLEGLLLLISAKNGGRIQRLGGHRLAASRAAL